MLTRPVRTAVCTLKPMLQKIQQMQKLKLPSQLLRTKKTATHGANPLLLLPHVQNREKQLKHVHSAVRRIQLIRMPTATHLMRLLMKQTSQRIASQKQHVQKRLYITSPAQSAVLRAKTHSNTEKFLDTIMRQQ